MELPAIHPEGMTEMVAGGAPKDADAGDLFQQLPCDRYVFTPSQKE